MSPLVRDAVGVDLPGAQGATVLDQDKIDDAMAGLCGAGVYDRETCKTHGDASAQRRAELR